MRVYCLLLLVACGADDEAPTPDANVATAPFVAMLCTSGNPGDPSCPITSVDLHEGSQLTLVAMGSATSVDITSPKLVAGPAGLYLEHPQFEGWPDGAAAPTPNPNDPNATTIINLAANAMTILTPTSVGSLRMVLAYDAIGSHR